MWEYRPISLIRNLYKIITKILAKSMSKVLSSAFDARKSAFLGGRNILDGVVIANKVVKEAKAKKKSCFAFKANFEKEYDSVRWDCLAYMLHRLGFCKKMDAMDFSSYVSILVNGSPTEEYSTQKGL